MRGSQEGTAALGRSTSSDLRRSGRSPPIRDSLIAATAAVHGFTVATRNLRDFSKTGVRVLDPFG